MSKEIFANRLKTAMERKGMKQVDLIRAAAAGGVKLGKSHMSQYVSGKTFPRADILRFLADTLKVSEEWLSGRDSLENLNGKAEKETDTVENNHKSKSGGTNMRVFKKSSKLDNVLYDVRGPVVDEAARMEEAGTQILKLNIGNPAPFGFQTPDEVI